MSDPLVPLIPAGLREVLCQALADAVSYRDPPLECLDCEQRDELCAVCSAGLAHARAYLALGRALGMDTR